MEEDQLKKSVGLHLGQNHPNPFNAATVIPFRIASTTKVQLVIYNSLGQPVRTLVNAEFTGGQHQALWDGRDKLGREVSSGIYFYYLKTGGETLQGRKMLLLK